MLISVSYIRETCARLLPLALLMAAPLPAAADEEVISRLRGKSAPLYAEANNPNSIATELTSVSEFLPIIVRVNRGDHEWAAIKIGEDLYYVKVADVVIVRVPTAQQNRGRTNLDAAGRTLR